MNNECPLCGATVSGDECFCAIENSWFVAILKSCIDAEGRLELAWNNKASFFCARSLGELKAVFEHFGDNLKKRVIFRVAEEGREYTPATKTLLFKHGELLTEHQKIDEEDLPWQ